MSVIDAIIAKKLCNGGGGGSAVPKPLTYDYMPEGYPKKTTGTVTVMEEQELAFTDGGGTYVANLPDGFKVTAGQTYVVNWDGTEYQCVGSAVGETYLIGNVSIAGESSNTGEPFVYVIATGAGAIGQFGTLDTSASHTISVKTIEETVTPMAYDYMPEGYPTKSVETVTVMEEQELAFAAADGGVYVAEQQSSLDIVEGQTYTVNWDGAEYECVGVYKNRRSYLGNLSIANQGDDTGEPFLYAYGGFGTLDTSASHTISVKTIEETVTPIAEKFLPESVATKSDVEVAQTAANAAQTTATNAQNAADNAQAAADISKSAADTANTTANTAKTAAKNAQTTANAAKTLANAAATKENPVFIGSFSQNRKVSSGIGDYSHAEGRSTTASGNSSHAEGNETTASGGFSHAEGINTTASGRASHAEGDGTTASGHDSHAEGGNTKASGSYSHAEGYAATASGSYSHAEGSSSNDIPDTITSSSSNSDIISAWKTTRFSLAKGTASHVEGRDNLALGEYSHAEGNETTVSGNCSHAEGENTTASGGYSHAEGLSTKAISECQHVQGKYNIEDSSNTYAHIVGNGDSATSCSNAHTLDWSGNAWFAGTVAGMALIIPSSTEGSTKKFKITVNDSGTISATEVMT